MGECSRHSGWPVCVCAVWRPGLDEVDSSTLHRPSTETKCCFFTSAPSLAFVISACDPRERPGSGLAHIYGGDGLGEGRELQDSLEESCVGHEDDSSSHPN